MALKQENSCSANGAQLLVRCWGIDQLIIIVPREIALIRALIGNKRPVPFGAAAVRVERRRAIGAARLVHGIHGPKGPNWAGSAHVLLGCPEYLRRFLA